MPGISPPFKPVGIGAAIQAYNVFQITFSQALSDIPFLTGFDDFNITTAGNTLFAGTTDAPSGGAPAGSGNKPLIAAIAGIQGSTAYPALVVTTGNATPNWFPDTSNGVGNTAIGIANHLNGSTDGINLSSAPPGLGGTVTFNLAYKFWQDLTTLSTMNGVVVCQYQYTGAAPTVTWAANKAPGTEVSPSWTPLVAYAAGVAPVSGDTTQIRPCDPLKGDPGGGGDGTYRQTIPSTGAVFPGEIWVKNFYRRNKWITGKLY